MPPALQPGMKSVLFEFVYRSDLPNKKQNIRICYYGPRVWQGYNIFFKNCSVHNSTNTYNNMKKLEDRHPNIKSSYLWVVNLWATWDFVCILCLVFQLPPPWSWITFTIKNKLFLKKLPWFIKDLTNTRVYKEKVV